MLMTLLKLNTETQMISDITTFSIEVKGRVQGVGYRAWVEKTAKNFDLVGWVMNCEDKSVRIKKIVKNKRIFANNMFSEIVNYFQFLLFPL